MNLKKLILTNNACFKAGRTIPPKGIMVHSTGASIASSVSWLTEASPLIKPYRGIIEAGMLEVQRTIHISALKSARTV
jgi:hypothetical protein